MRILFLSIGFVVQDTPSDKNFWKQIIQSLPEHFVVGVWSLNDATPRKELSEDLGREVHYRSKNRLFHNAIFADPGEAYIPHHQHSDARNGLELLVSNIWYFLTDIRSFIVEFRPNVIHLTDSFGPSANILRWLFPDIIITLTKPTVRLSNNSSPVYKSYVAHSLKYCDAICTHTHVSRDYLSGLTTAPIYVHPWGTNQNLDNTGGNEKELIRQRYGCRKIDKLICLSDRFLDTATDEFFDNLSCFSEKIFVLAIRPTRYLTAHQRFSRNNVVVVSGPVDFYAFLEAADLLVSPPELKSEGCSSLLPLAWIDALARGTPLLCASQPGIEDIIADNRIGMIIPRGDFYQILSEEMINITLDSAIPDHCRLHCSDIFSITSSMNRYHKLWENLMINSQKAQASID